MCEKRVTLSGSIRNLTPEGRVAIRGISLDDVDCAFDTDGYKCSVPFTEATWSGSLQVDMRQGEVCRGAPFEWEGEPSGSLGTRDLVVADSEDACLTATEATLQ